jgi:polyisoprenoid-binding protein YceI
MNTTNEASTDEASIQAAAGTWKVAPNLSGAVASSKLLRLIAVPAKLAITSGTITLTDGTVTIDVRLDPKSVDTGNAKRDEHLRHADFLDVSTYPEATFKATQQGVEKWGSGKSGSIKGVLTVKDKAATITLHVDNLVIDPTLKTATFSASGTVNRNDLGLSKGPGFMIKRQLQLSATITAHQA